MLRKETRNYARITSRDYCQREDAYIISLEGANHKQVRCQVRPRRGVIQKSRKCLKFDKLSERFDAKIIRTFPKIKVIFIQGWLQRKNFKISLYF